MRRSASTVAWVVALGLGASAKAPCACSKVVVPERLAAPREFVIPTSIATRELPSQLVLIKVPETGSSTAANLLSALAERAGVPSWHSGLRDEFESVVARPSKASPKWSLGHYPFGDWISSHFAAPVLITTVREPLARLTSHTEKRAQRGEIDCADSSSRCACDKGMGVALKFWGGGSPQAILDKFESIWITERYNESLVAFAVHHRLGLGDVLPPLAKYHKPTHDHAVSPLRGRIRTACERQATKEIDLERKVHALASLKLDAHLKALDDAGVDARALVAKFADYLDLAMSLGKSRKVASGAKHNTSTLILDDCVRRCVAHALNTNVRVTYVGRTMSSTRLAAAAPPTTVSHHAHRRHHSSPNHRR